MGIKTTNAELLDQINPLVQSLGKLTLEGVGFTEKALIRLKYVEKLLNPVLESVNNCVLAEQQIIGIESNVTHDDIGNLKLSEKGVKEREALLATEIEIATEPIILPHFVYGQDTLEVTYLRRDGTPRIVNESVTAVMAALKKFVNIVEIKTPEQGGN